jgi:uncharacterized protein (DUF58 family)
MPLATAIDWGSIAPLRLRARTIAEGVYAGAHRSLRKGAGVEFGGHRPYVPGDDLRWLDRRAMMRHDRLIVREFETETDRGLRLLMDATGSMGFRGGSAPASKFAYAALVAAALARVALASGDPVGLDWLGGEPGRPLPALAGREAFERIVGALEGSKVAGDLSRDEAAIERALSPIARKARRGTIVVLLSDLLDLPPGAVDRFVALSGEGRILVVVQVLDPDEAHFPFEGTVRLRALEGQNVVETDAEVTRGRYLEALAALAEGWQTRLSAHAGHFIRATTSDDAASIVRAVVAAVAGRSPAPRERA